MENRKYKVLSFLCTLVVGAICFLFVSALMDVSDSSHMKDLISTLFPGLTVLLSIILIYFLIIAVLSTSIIKLVNIFIDATPCMVFIAIADASIALHTFILSLFFGATDSIVPGIIFFGAIIFLFVLSFIFDLIAILTD
ncbi:MAG: hypothetical protein E7617_05155 [Ruminococcaceae bacterium]|nr:hypothetical protein [Oscillospiraceae bacterium]